MTTTTLRNHPYAQCRVYEDADYIEFWSYRTMVIRYHKSIHALECTGTYSATTRKQIGWFLREYFPTVATYYDMKRIAATGELMEL